MFVPYSPKILHTFFSRVDFYLFLGLRVSQFKGIMNSSHAMRKEKTKEKPFGTQPSKSVHSRILTRIFPSFWPKGLSQVIMEDKLELLILFSTLKKCRNVDVKLSVFFSTKNRLVKKLLKFSFQELTELFNSHLCQESFMIGMILG